MQSFTITITQQLQQIGIDGSALPITSHVLACATVAIVSWLSFILCYYGIMPLLIKLAEKTKVEWDDILLNHQSLKRACQIVPAIVAWALLPQVFYKYLNVMEMLTRATGVYISFATMRFVLAFINSFKGFEGKRRTSMQQYFHTFCGVLKIAAIFISIIIMVSIIIDRSPLRLLAGLGATSAILMLVFKDTIVGLVSGIRLTSNNMLHKGDWITLDKAGINGFVEDMTLSTVKVRNFDNTIVTVSPNTLVNESFQNWATMLNGGGRRVKRTIYIDFRSIFIASTELKKQLAEKHYIKTDEIKNKAVNLSLFRHYVEQWLYQRNDVNHDMLYMVRQLEATNTGLPIEIYFFVKQKQWKDYEHHLADIMEYIYAILPDFQLKIYQRYSDK